MGEIEDILSTINKVDTTPTIPLTEVQKVRFSEMAKDLDNARIQGYVEANVLMKALELVKEFLPIITKI